MSLLVSTPTGKFNPSLSFFDTNQGGFDTNGEGPMPSPCVFDANGEVQPLPVLSWGGLIGFQQNWAPMFAWPPTILSSAKSSVQVLELAKSSLPALAQPVSPPSLCLPEHPPPSALPIWVRKCLNWQNRVSLPLLKTELPILPILAWAPTTSALPIQVHKCSNWQNQASPHLTTTHLPLFCPPVLTQLPPPTPIWACKCSNLWTWNWALILNRRFLICYNSQFEINLSFTAFSVAVSTGKL